MCCYVQCIRETKIKAARMGRDCDASLFIREAMGGFKFTFAERRAIVKARSESWRILKGQPYIQQFNRGEDGTYTFNARPEIHAICVKYDFYRCC